MRRKPYSVVLLDEIEKAHPDVLATFYNIFDKGVMEDGTGLVVDFRNTVMLATSNVGAELLLETPVAQLGCEAFNETLHKALLKAFRPALLARMSVIAYSSLDETTLKTLAIAKLEILSQRYHAATGKQFDFDAGVVNAVLAKCNVAAARDMENKLTTAITEKLAKWPLD
nr:AAA family ATPase [Jeongeupia sp. USM3]